MPQRHQSTKPFLFASEPWRHKKDKIEYYFFCHEDTKALSHFFMPPSLGGIKKDKIEHYFFCHKDTKVLSYFFVPPSLGGIKEDKIEQLFFATKTPKH